MLTERLTDPQVLGWLAWLLGLAVLAAAGAVRGWCADPADDADREQLFAAHGDVPTVSREQTAPWAQAAMRDHRA